MFYEIHNGLVAISMPLLPKLYILYLFEQRTHRPITFLDPYETTTCTHARTVRDWNILPEAIVMATSFETFKDSISQ